MGQQSSHLIQVRPLSTFSSTPNNSPRSLTFNDLAGTQPTDNEDDQKQIKQRWENW